MYQPLVEMSTPSQKKVEIILGALMKYLGVDNQRQLAIKLGISAQAVNKWYKNASIPVKKLKSMYPELSADYLASGIGSIVEGDLNEPITPYISTNKVDDVNQLQKTIEGKIQELVAVSHIQARLSDDHPGYLDAVLASTEVLKQLIAEIEELAEAQKSNPHSDS